MGGKGNKKMEVFYVTKMASQQEKSTGEAKAKAAPAESDRDPVEKLKEDLTKAKHNAQHFKVLHESSVGKLHQKEEELSEVSGTWHVTCGTRHVARGMWRAGCGSW